MTVINTQSQAAAISPNSKANSSGVADITPPSAATKPSNGAQATVVNISGHAMLLSRLFNTTDMNADIPVEYVHKMNTGQSFYISLTKDDRKMLETAYQYVSKNGMDPRYVDDMAFDLANYRAFPNAKGPLGDMAGHRLTFEFSVADTKVMDRIKNSDAINQTSIDRGFVDYVGPGHAVNFQFLEKMISVFSTSADKTPAASGNDTIPSFTSYVPQKNDFITHVSAEVVWAIPKPEELGKATSGSRNGIDLPQLLTASNKKILSQAFLSLLAQRPGEASARLKDIASLLDLSLTNPGGGKAVPDPGKNGTLFDVINNLNHFLDHNSSQNSFDAGDFLKQIFGQKIDTSA